jgi:homoserine O-acetyltransferase
MTTDGTSTFETDFLLGSGHTLRNAKLVYKTYGTLNSTGDNAILFPTRFGAGHTMNEFLVKPGSALDPDKYFIVIPNLLGNGFSSSPSNHPHPYSGPRFPLVTIADNVKFQNQLAEKLGIRKFALAVGWSMGAQQAYHWAAHYPDMVERLCVICGTAKTALHNIVFLESIRAGLTADSAYEEGWYTTPPRKGLRAMGRIYAGWAYSQDWYRAEKFRTLGYSSLDDWLIAYWDALFEKREANDLLSMAATWIANDVSADAPFNGDLPAALGAITAKTFLMPCSHDLYFRTADSEIELTHLKSAELVEIPSIWGHMCASGQNPEDTAFIDEQLKKLLQS